jgi:hypothetical protein
MLASNVTPAVKAYADSIENSGTQSDATKSARQKLITDLEHTGMNAQTATGYVDNLTKGLAGLPKNVSTNITDSVTGNGTIKATQSITGQATQMIGQLKFVASGGHITGPGGPTEDRIPAMLSNGEYVVNAASVKKLGVGTMNAINKYAAGGPVGFSAAENSISQIIPTSNAASATFSQNVATAFAKAAQAQNRTEANSVSTAGLSGGLVAIVKEIAARLGWNGGQVEDWLNVIQRESGGSMTAKNPSSGAYGIAQFINGPVEYAQWGGNVNTLAGQLTAQANYIKARYGTPAAAWAHELSAGWYSRGGLAGNKVAAMAAHAGGRGFAVGGVLPESMTAYGNSTGNAYTFGEGGRVENVSYGQNNNANMPSHSQIDSVITLLQALNTGQNQGLQMAQRSVSPNMGNATRVRGSIVR